MQKLADISKFQNLINDACRALEDTKPDKINELQEGLKDLW